MKKKLAFFLPYLEVGGVERLYVNYANHLMYTYDVTLIVCSADGAYRKDLHSDIHIVELTGTRIRTSLFKLIRELRRSKYDYLIGSNMLANMVMLAAKPFCRKTKYIVFQHNYMNNETMHMGAYAKYSMLYMRWLYPKADKVIAVSAGIKDFLIKELSVPENKVEVVYNAVDIDDIKEKAREEVEYPQGDYIVYVGRMTIVKNIPFLLKAFDAISKNDIQLLIIGDGPYEKEVRASASACKRKNDIIFAGSKSNPMPYLNKAKCLVLPSTSESFGLVLLEALCLNKPIVSTPTKGALEVLDGCKNAFITTTFDDPQELSLLIEKACNHQCENDDRTMMRFAIETSIKKLVEVIESI